MSARGIRRMVPSAAALVLAVLLVVASGCGDRPQTASSHSATPTPSATPIAGGALTVAYLAQPRSLDPALAMNVTERSVADAVSEGLLRYAAEPALAGTALVPCLAMEVPTVANGGLSADGRTYTFTIRSGVSFQPPINRELTALDVKYSLERVLDTAPADSRELLRNVAGTARFLAGTDAHVRGIEVVDDATLRIRLVEPDPSFLNALAEESCHVVPREWVERWGEEFEEHPLGTGPFTFLKWIHGQSVKLARNPRYWESGRPHVDAVDCDLTLAPDAALASLGSGEIDALGFGLPADALADVTPGSALESQLASRSLLTGTYLVLNTRVAPFKDVDVRRAVRDSIDRDRLAEIEARRAEPLRQYYPLDLPGYDDAAVFAHHAPAQARALLRRAGHKDGLTTVLTVERGVYDAALVEAVRTDLAAVGVRTRLETLSGGQYRRRMAKPEGFAMTLVTWHASLPDPGEWVETMCGRDTARPGGTNLSHWSSARLEAQRARADALADPAARIAAYSAMQETIADGVPYVPLISSLQTSGCSRNVQGFYLHPLYVLDLASYWKR